MPRSRTGRRPTLRPASPTRPAPSARPATSSGAMSGRRSPSSSRRCACCSWSTRASIALDEPAGPPGSTVRHLLAHASGLGFDEGAALSKPERRRVYSNAGFDLLGALVSERTGLPFARYVAAGSVRAIRDASFKHRGDAVGGRCWATGRPVEVRSRTPAADADQRRRRWRWRQLSRFPASTAFCLATGGARPTTGAWVLSFATRRSRIGQGGTTRRPPLGISAEPAASCGSTRRWASAASR